MADTNLITIQGTYQGALSANSPVLFGKNNSVDNSANIPVMVTGLGTSAQDNAPYSFVGGRAARSNSSCSFVFNGASNLDGDPQKTSYTENSPYLGANNEGTASFNLNGGLNGMYIGDKSLFSHMDSLSTFAAEQITSSDIRNNVLHRTGEETASGNKTFTDTAYFGSDGDNRTSIGSGNIGFYDANDYEANSRISVNGSGNLEIESVTTKVKGDAEFEDSVTIDDTLSLAENANADFSNGTVYVKTEEQTEVTTGDDKAASTKYVHDAIINRMTGGGVYDDSGIYTGENTFANNISLSSHRVNTEPLITKVEVDLTNGNTFVADSDINANSSLAANCKFVKDVANSYYSKFSGGKKQVGSGINPVYLNGSSSLNASLVPSTSTVGSDNQHMYMSSGVFKGSSGNIGGANSPVYLNSGRFTECNSLVNVSFSQEINGVKTFTNTTWQSNGVRIYSNKEKGSDGIHEGIYFVAAENLDGNAIEKRIGQINCDFGSTFGVTEMRNYRNEANTNEYAVLGVRVSKDGKMKQAYTEYPTGGQGEPYESIDETSTVIPNIGWTNKHYMRKDIDCTVNGKITFSSNVLFKNNASFEGPIITYSNVEIYGEYPFIDFHAKNTSQDYTARIIQRYGGSLRIIPCDNTKANTAADSAANIWLGTQTIGSNTVDGCQPIYLNQGRINALDKNVGGTNRLVYMSSGKLVPSTWNFGNDSAQLLRVNNGSLAKSSITWGNAETPLYLNSGSFYKTFPMMTASGKAEQVVYGVKKFVNGPTMPNIELYHSNPFIDFHCNNKTDVNYTGRIIQKTDGHIYITPCAVSEVGGNNDTALRIHLGSKTVGSQTNPIYLSSGVPASMSTTVGSKTKPVYMNLGSITAINASVGSSIRPVYFNNGEITAVNSFRFVGFASFKGPCNITVPMNYFAFSSLSNLTSASIRYVIANFGSGNPKASIGAVGWEMAANGWTVSLTPYATSRNLYLQNSSLTCNVQILAYD